MPSTINETVKAFLKNKDRQQICLQRISSLETALEEKKEQRIFELDLKLEAAKNAVSLLKDTRPSTRAREDAKRRRSVTRRALTDDEKEVLRLKSFWSGIGVRLKRIFDPLAFDKAADDVEKLRASIKQEYDRDLSRAERMVDYYQRLLDDAKMKDTADEASIRGRILKAEQELQDLRAKHDTLRDVIEKDAQSDLLIQMHEAGGKPLDLSYPELK